MGTLRAHKDGGYSTDGAIKTARRNYRCEVCTAPIPKGMKYERVYALPVHVGAHINLKGLDCNPFDGKGSAPECPTCHTPLIGYFNAAGYPIWACGECEWESVPFMPTQGRGAAQAAQ